MIGTRCYSFINFGTCTRVQGCTSTWTRVRQRICTEQVAAVMIESDDDSEVLGIITNDLMRVYDCTRVSTQVLVVLVECISCTG